MNRERIKKKLMELCTEIFQNSGVDIVLFENVDFIDDLGMDSIMFITMIIEIETAFNITIPDELLLMENFKNMDNITQNIIDILTK